jgi:hypothetical protein
MPRPSPRKNDHAKKPTSFFRGQLPLENETVWFILVSALDVFMTYVLIRQPHFTEGNPIAAFFLNHWGVKGMVYFKFFMVAFITLITQIIARTRVDIAARILQFATVVVAGVVIYSLTLYLRHA